MAQCSKQPQDPQAFEGRPLAAPNTNLTNLTVRRPGKPASEGYATVLNAMSRRSSRRFGEQKARVPRRTCYFWTRGFAFASRNRLLPGFRELKSWDEDSHAKSEALRETKRNHPRMTMGPLLRSLAPAGALVRSESGSCLWQMVGWPRPVFHRVGYEPPEQSHKLYRARRIKQVHQGRVLGNSLW